MNRRVVAIWGAFAVFLAVGLAAMVWISRLALDLESAETQARAVAAHEENIRLALWRMETLAAPIVATEAGKSLVGPVPGVRFPNSADSLALGYFRVDALSKVTFMQVRNLDSKDWDEQVLSRVPITRGLPPLDDSATPVVASVPIIQKFRTPAAQTIEPQGLILENQMRQQAMNAGEFNARSNITSQSTIANSLQFEQTPSLYDTREGRAAAFWLDGHLILARRYQQGGEIGVVGCLLDTDGLCARLFESIRDLLPGARLEPATGQSEDAGRTLASFPFRLEPGPIPSAMAAQTSRVMPVLVAAWSSLALAFIASAALLAGLIALGERRRTFVSSVTHELRTPLTTFRLYTEMLLAGMVKDPEQQREYLGTLHAEAVRLTHLVENVLAYARVERGRRPANLTTLSLEETLAGMEARLQRRAAEAGLELNITAPAASVRADGGCLEQILFNLVDNACKYATPTSESRIDIHAEKSPRGVTIRVRDFGPGIDGTRASRLFRPFSKSAEQAASSAPGIGLGLELSRRLARAMGGDLHHDATVAPGACFVVRLREG
ncbi:sensor histidine kinase [bacterium]|nr:sensor histidine kinase [bacterium]